MTVNIFLASTFRVGLINSQMTILHHGNNSAAPFRARSFLSSACFVVIYEPPLRLIIMLKNVSPYCRARKLHSRRSEHRSRITTPPLVSSQRYTVMETLRNAIPGIINALPVRSISPYLFSPGGLLSGSISFRY